MLLALYEMRRSSRCCRRYVRWSMATFESQWPLKYKDAPANVTWHARQLNFDIMGRVLLVVFLSRGRHIEEFLDCRKSSAAKCDAVITVLMNKSITAPLTTSLQLRLDSPGTAARSREGRDSELRKSSEQEAKSRLFYCFRCGMHDAKQDCSIISASCMERCFVLVSTPFLRWKYPEHLYVSVQVGSYNFVLVRSTSCCFVQLRVGSFNVVLVRSDSCWFVQFRVGSFSFVLVRSISCRFVQPRVVRSTSCWFVQLRFGPFSVVLVHHCHRLLNVHVIYIRAATCFSVSFA